MTARGAAAAAFGRLPASVRRALLHRVGRFAPWEEGFDFTPPALGPDEVTGPPDFVGIGAQKAGTTWWYELIAAHPGVWSRPDLHKERHFLARFGETGFGPEDAVAYHRWFPRRPGTMAGEWTPDYLHWPWVPGLLASAAPVARLLVMLRDPVERFCSGVAHEWRNGAARRPATTSDAIARGLYFESLRRWWAHFEEGRMLVLQYERCLADPRSQIARTYRFLGLDSSYEPARLERRVSETGAGRLVPDEELRRRLVEIYQSDVSALVRHLPDIDLALWPNFAQVGVA